MISRTLEPAALIANVGIEELLITFCEVNNSFNQPDDSENTKTKSAGRNTNEKRNNKHDDAFCFVSQNEFMNSQSP